MVTLFPLLLSCALFFAQTEQCITPRHGLHIQANVMGVGTGLSEEFPNSFPQAKEKSYKIIKAYVTAYTLRPEETDDTPCIGASGDNLCDLNNSVACPRRYPFGTVVSVGGQSYTCRDRLHVRFDKRFDIQLDDLSRAKDWGIRYLEIKIYDND